jgi:hypothetical protein
MQEVFRQRLDCTFYIHEQVLQVGLLEDVQKVITLRRSDVAEAEQATS